MLEKSHPNGITAIRRKPQPPDPVALAAEALLAALADAGIAGPEAVRQAKRALRDALDGRHYPPAA